MKENDRLIHGVYVVERRWDLIWLKNKIKNINETIKDDKFYVMILQAFGSDYSKKILEALSEEKKLIIDFDNEKVKVIDTKDIPFHQSLSFYFNPQTIQNELDTGEKVDIYGYDKEDDQWLK